MKKRRGQKNPRTAVDLCSGPGKLCEAMGIDKTKDRLSLNGTKLWITEGINYKSIARVIKIRPRVGINYAKEAIDWPLRFSIPATAKIFKQFFLKQK